MPSLDEATIQMAIHTLSIGAAPFMLFVSLIALYVRISASRTLRKEEQFALRAQQVAPNWLSQEAASYAELVDSILKEAETELRAKSGFLSRLIDYLFTQRTDWEEFRTNLRPWVENSHGALTQEDFRSAVRAARASTRSLTHLLGGIPVESGARFVGALPGILFLLGVFASCLGVAAAIPELVNRLAETPMDIAPLRDFAHTVSWFFGPAALGMALFVGLSGLNLMFPVHSKLRTLGEEIGGLLSFVWNNRNQTHTGHARETHTSQPQSPSPVLEAMAEVETPTENEAEQVTETVVEIANKESHPESQDEVPEPLSSDLLAQLEASEQAAETEESRESEASADVGEPLENTWVDEAPEAATPTHESSTNAAQPSVDPDLIVEGDVPEEDKILLAASAEAKESIVHEDSETEAKETIVHDTPETESKEIIVHAHAEEPVTESSEHAVATPEANESTDGETKEDASEWQVSTPASTEHSMPDQMSYGGIPTDNNTHESEEALEEFPEPQVSGPMRPPEVAFGGIPLGESFPKQESPESAAEASASTEYTEADEASNAMATLLEKMQQERAEEKDENTVTHSGVSASDDLDADANSDSDIEQTNTEIPPPNITAESMQDILDQIEARRAQRPAQESETEASEDKDWEEKQGSWNETDSKNAFWGASVSDPEEENQTGSGLPKPPAPLWNRPSQANWDAPSNETKAPESPSHSDLSPLDQARTRLKEVELQIQQAYEDKISGKITNALWLQMHTQWAIEKEKLLKEISELEKAA
ncbi:MAG: hypothetical protein H6617_04065 [Bdellovibrionaceae bacterium]|nr:hypothetical protein [Bdellovibrionales bacterium]MCB9253834.1 hypothetical protein [Pseudobdellovibrionaceae bacterium]